MDFALPCCTIYSGKMMLNQYMVIKTLGKGNFGTVRLCFNLQDKRLYAIKVRLSLITSTRRFGPSVAVLTAVCSSNNVPRHAATDAK